MKNVPDTAAAVVVAAAAVASVGIVAVASVPFAHNSSVVLPVHNTPLNSFEVEVDVVESVRLAAVA